MYKKIFCSVVFLLCILVSCEDMYYGYWELGNDYAYIENREIVKIRRDINDNPLYDILIRGQVLNYDEVLREIGLNANGEIILKMPDKRNFGFWMDTNLKFKDFKDKFDIEMITEQEFNDLWNSVVYDRDADEFKPVVINRKVL